MRPQKRRLMHYLAVLAVKGQEVSRMLDPVDLSEFFLQLGDRRVLFLSREKSLHIFDLVLHPIVDNVKQIRAQDKPHARAKNDLTNRKDRDVPECEADAN